MSINNNIIINVKKATSGLLEQQSERLMQAGR